MMERTGAYVTNPPHSLHNIYFISLSTSTLYFAHNKLTKRSIGHSIIFLTSYFTLIKSVFSMVDALRNDGKYLSAFGAYC